MEKGKTKYIKLSYGVCETYGHSNILRRLAKCFSIKRYYIPIGMTHLLERDLTTKGLIF